MAANAILSRQLLTTPSALTALVLVGNRYCGDAPPPPLAATSSLMVTQLAGDSDLDDLGSSCNDSLHTIIVTSSPPVTHLDGDRDLYQIALVDTTHMTHANMAPQLSNANTTLSPWQHATHLAFHRCVGSSSPQSHMHHIVRRSHRRSCKHAIVRAPHHLCAPPCTCCLPCSRALYAIGCRTHALSCPRLGAPPLAMLDAVQPRYDTNCWHSFRRKLTNISKEEDEQEEITHKNFATP